MYLPVSVSEFAATFVGRSDSRWLPRFYELASRKQVRIFMGTTAPGRDARDADWLHNAETMFKHAKKLGGSDVTLIVLWDEEQSGSTGGVSDFVKLAKEAAVRVQIIESRLLFGLDPKS